MCGQMSLLSMLAKSLTVESRKRLKYSSIKEHSLTKSRSFGVSACGDRRGPKAAAMRGERSEEVLGK